MTESGGEPEGWGIVAREPPRCQRILFGSLRKFPPARQLGVGPFLFPRRNVSQDACLSSHTSPRTHTSHTHTHPHIDTHAPSSSPASPASSRRAAGGVRRQEAAAGLGSIAVPGGALGAEGWPSPGWRIGIAPPLLRTRQRDHPHGDENHAVSDSTADAPPRRGRQPRRRRRRTSRRAAALVQSTPRRKKPKQHRRCLGGG